MQNQSLGQTILALFLAPTKAFDGIKESASWQSWVYPLIIVSVLLALVPLTYQEITLDEAERNLIRVEKNFHARGDIPDAQREKVQERFDKGHNQIQQARENPWALKRLAGYLLLPVSYLVMSAVFGLILMGIGNFGMGGKTSFQQMLSVVMLSYLIGGSGFFFNMAQGIGSLELIVKAPFIMMKAGTDISFSPGLLFESLDSYLKVFLNQLDVFRLWSMLVLGIGFAKLYDKSTGTGITVVSIVWLIFSAIGAAGLYVNQSFGA